MRHMRSRRILAMLLALSMIFGLLTTTALADNEVDQNTSNVEENAANGTSEGGSGEGQSSGASDGQPSQETNKEDVSTEEETIPEEKKTTSSEEVDTQAGEGKTPVEETTYVASIGEQGYASLDAAIQAAASGATVTLLDNVELTATLTISNKDITLDVDSNTLTVSVSNGDGIVVENATLTLASSGTGKYVFKCSARNSDGIYVNNTDASTTSTLNLNGDVEINVQASVNSAIHAYATAGNAIVNINGGKITATGSGKQFKAIHVDQNATLNMAGGELDITVDFDSYSDNNDVVGVLIFGNSSKQENCHVVISDGIFKVGGKNAFAQVVQVGMVNGYSENCDVSITGGTVKLEPTENGTGYVYAPYKASYATAAISGGTVTGTVTALVNAYISDVTNDGLTVTGGTFTNISADEMSKYLPEGTTYDETTGKVSSGSSEKLIETSEELAEAIANASDGDTIKLAAGEFTTYGNPSPKKSLTFVGSGEGTVWTIGDLDNTPGGEKNGDYSFDGCDTITFKNMTLKSDGADYRGFIRISNTIVDDCVLSGKTAYWGYETAKFINSKFNAPEGDYALWDYSSKSMSFDGCEFNISGKGVNVYVEAGNAGTDARKVEVKDCTVTSTKENKAFLNIKNSTQAYDVTISGNNTVNGLAANGTTGSNLYQVEATEITEASGKPLTVKQVDAEGNESILYQVKKQTGVAKGTEANPYTLEELGAMTRDAYIAAQDALGGTMYVTVGDYSYGKDGVLGNGKRDDTTGQTEDRNVLNGYNSNGYLGEKNDGANGLNIVFVNGSITSGVTGYESIDNIGTSLLLAVPAYTNVTFKGITFNNVMSFNYQLYTGPWSQLGELKFDGCTFNGIIVGATAAQTLTFNSCTFNNYTNTTDANSSNPTWIRPAYGNWKESDNDGQGPNFQSLTTINFTNNTVTSTRPVKFEYISQWNNTTTLTATGNTFDISAQADDSTEGKTKNVGLYIGPHTDENAVNLVLDNNTKSEGTAALYVIPNGTNKLPVGSTVTDLSGNPIEITDALEWKTDTKVTLKTEKDSTGTTNVAKVGETEYATLEAAVAAVTDTDNTITLLTDVIQNTSLSISKSLTLNLNGHKIYNTVDIWHDSTGDDDPNIVSLISIDGGASVTITGNGTIDAKENDCYTINVVNGELTIENGTFYGNISVVQVQKGKLTVKDGTFDLHQKWEGTNKYLLNCIDVEFASGAAAVAIYGGTFVDFDPNVSPEQKVDGVTPSFAAPGVGITKNADGTFSAASGMAAQVLDANGNSVMPYASLVAAIAAAEAGQTVRLLTDATEDVTITKNITLDLGGKTLTNTNAGHATITIANGATATVKNGSVVGGTSYYNIQNNGTATFEGLTATAGNTGSSMLDNWGTLTITSGTYTGGLNVVKSEEDSTLTINGGTFTRNSAPRYGITGTILVYGTTTINGGEFTEASSSNNARVLVTGLVSGHPSVTYITGGKFVNKNYTLIFHYLSPATSDNFQITGGTFNREVSDWFFADGYYLTKNGSTYGVAQGEYVATIGKVGYPTLAAALEAASGGNTIKLVKDVTLEDRLVISKRITLDLGGNTLTSNYAMGDKSGAERYALVNDKYSLTIKNGVFAAGEARAIGAYATLTLNGVTVTQTLTGGHACVAFCKDKTKYTITDSKIDGAYAVCNFANNATVTISGSTLNGTGNTLYHNGTNYGLKLTVTKTTITSSGSCGVYISGSTSAQANANNQNGAGGYQQATFTGCTISGTNGVEVKYTDLTLDNCTVTATDKNPSYKQDNNGPAASGFAVVSTDNAMNGVTPAPAGTIIVTGENGNYTGPVGLGSLASIKTDYPEFKDETVKVSGGTFDHAIPYEYCADGYIPADKGDGKYGVKEGTYVAEVGGQKYMTLQEAINAASRNQTVKLIADTTENVTMKTSDLTLDLNGHTLNGGQVKGKPALTVTARVTVKDSSANMSGTIKREDTAENSGVSSHYVIDVQGGGWLTFESGNVTNDSGVVGVKGASLVRVGDDSVEKYPGLNIKGGNFKQDNFIAIKVDRGDLFLNGGTITSANSYAIENWHRATIKGGTVKGSVASWTYSGGSNSTTTIIGGTINGNVNSVNYGNAEGKTAKVTISGGTVNGELDTRSYDPTTNELTSIDDAAKSTIGVTGGTFNNDPTKYVVEGSTVKSNTDGTFGVEKAYLATVGDKSYYTMEEAFKAQTASGEAIVLLRDYTTGSSFPSGSINRTVDLNNHTWTYTGKDTNCAAFEVNNSNVTLTVKNGKVVSNSMVGLIPSAMGGTITYDNSGLVFESVEATAKGNSGIETNGNNTNDTVTLKNSTLNVPNGFGIYFPSSGTLTIENSQITAKTLGVQVCSGSLDIKGQNAAITVNGDPVPKTENDGSIQDGAAISIVNRTGYKGLGTITVTGGTFTAKSGNAAVKAYNWENKTASDFTASDKVAISGGTFSSAVAPEYCAEGFVPKDNDDGTYGVQPDGNVAEIGSVKYTSLDEALKAAKDRETVKLLKDVEATQVLVTKGTLDLNGKTLKVSYFMSFSDVIDSTEGNGLIETGVQSFFTTNNSYLPLRDSAANGYRLFSYKLNKLGVVEGSSTAFWFNIIFGGEKAYSLLNTAGHNADLFIPMQIGSGNEWQYIKMNQSTLMKWTTPILNGTAPSKCGYYVNITGLDTLTSGTVLTLKTSIRSCGVEKLSDDSLTYTVK